MQVRREEREGDMQHEHFKKVYRLLFKNYIKIYT